MQNTTTIFKELQHIFKEVEVAHSEFLKNDKLSGIQVRKSLFELRRLAAEYRIASITESQEI